MTAFALSHTATLCRNHFSPQGVLQVWLLRRGASTGLQRSRPLAGAVRDSVVLLPRSHAPAAGRKEEEVAEEVRMLRGKEIDNFYFD